MVKMKQLVFKVLKIKQSVFKQSKIMKRNKNKTRKTDWIGKNQIGKAKQIFESKELKKNGNFKICGV